MLSKQGQSTSHRIHRWFWSWQKMQQYVKAFHQKAAHYKSCQQRTKVATLKNISIKFKTVTFNCSINYRSIWIFLHMFLVLHGIQATRSLPGPTARTVFDPAKTWTYRSISNDTIKRHNVRTWDDESKPFKNQWYCIAKLVLTITQGEFVRH